MALLLSGLGLLGLREPTLSIGKVWERRVRCCLASTSPLSRGTPTPLWPESEPVPAVTVVFR